MTGQRKALETAIERKRNAEEIIDSVTADEAGKLPDKSITEVLQRVVGMTMDHTRAKMTGAIDEQFKFNPEGAGIQTRGLSWGNTTVNGHESFSAGWPGREISWDEVPSEIMQGVDVYKNPSAEVIEGGISGSIDMRTKLPFDSKDKTAAFSTGISSSKSGITPKVSGMYSRRWDSPVGELGWIVDMGYEKNNYRNENTGFGYFYPNSKIHTTVPGQTAWVPSSYSWNQDKGTNERGSLYAAFQWKKGDKQSSVTYFDSNRRSSDVQFGMGVGADDPYQTVITNGKYDAHGVFQSGNLSYPGGIGLNEFVTGGLHANSFQGYSNTMSRTRELAWNFKWVINDRWSMQNDLQWEHATNSTKGAQIGLSTFVPGMNLDLSKGTPVASFDSTTTAFLANPNNYYLNFIQPNMNRASADLVALKTDGKFMFDSDVLRDFRFGMRLTTRKAIHQNPGGSGWYGVGQDWAVMQTLVPGTLPVQSQFDFSNDWKNLNSPYMNDPRYALPGTNGGVSVNSFGGSNSGMPSVVVPSVALLKDYPNAYKQMAMFRKTLCYDAANVKFAGDPARLNTKLHGDPNQPGDRGCDGQGTDFTPQTYDESTITDPSNTSQATTDKHSEGTQALYGSLRFAFDQWKIPVEGFAGLRVVRTRAIAHGFAQWGSGLKADGNPAVPKFDLTTVTPIDVVGTRVDAIPSLNLKAAFSPTLQGRVAMSKGIYRPGFNQLQEYITYNQNVTYVKDAQGNDTSQVAQVTYTGSNSGNAKLKPVKADNLDLTLEWYPKNGQSVTAALFGKQVKDIIMSDTYTRTLTDLAGNTQDFTVTGPANAAKLWQAGFEVSGMTYLDKLPVLDTALPDWAKGFGISSNASILYGKQTLYHPYNGTYCPANGSGGAALNLYGCDTNGMPFKNLPVPYWSKFSYNMALLYDHGPISARLAYNWRARALVATNAYGTGGGNATTADPTRIAQAQAQGLPIPTDVGFGLPVWDSARGQLDGGFSYNVTSNMSVSFSVSNLGNTVFKSYYQQTPGYTFKSADSSGRSYSLSGNYWF